MPHRLPAIFLVFLFTRLLTIHAFSSYIHPTHRCPEQPTPMIHLWLHLASIITVGDLLSFLLGYDYAPRLGIHVLQVLIATEMLSRGVDIKGKMPNAHPTAPQPRASFAGRHPFPNLNYPHKRCNTHNQLDDAEERGRIRSPCWEGWPSWWAGWSGRVDSSKRRGDGGA